MPRSVRIAETPPRFPLKVLGHEVVGPGVFCLHLETHPLPWQAGDCVTLFAPGEDSGRPYSFSGPPEEECSEFWIREVPGGLVSSFLAGCSPGDVVEVSPPFGWFRPAQPDGVPKLFVATGTGIAPFLSALRSGSASETCTLLWGMRNALVVPECLKGCSMTRCVSREDIAGTHSGRVTELLGEVNVSPDLHVYLCGLDAMIEEASAILSERGVPAERIHREVFFTEST